MKRWFVTWNRSEYKEWATKIPKGYLLVILRREKSRYLCVKATLIMGRKGLPGFKVVEEKYLPTRTGGLQQIQEWRT